MAFLPPPLRMFNTKSAAKGQRNSPLLPTPQQKTALSAAWFVRLGMAIKQTFTAFTTNRHAYEKNTHYYYNSLGRLGRLLG